MRGSFASQPPDIGFVRNAEFGRNSIGARHALLLRRGCAGRAKCASELHVKIGMIALACRVVANRGGGQTRTCELYVTRVGIVPYTQVESDRLANALCSTR